MAAQIVLMIGCGTAIGLWSVLFNVDSGKFQLLKAYNYSNVGYFAQTDNATLYATSTSAMTGQDRVIKFLVNDATQGNLTEFGQTNLTQRGGAYLHAQSINNTARRLAVAFYGSGYVGFVDDPGTTALVLDTEYQLTNYSNADPGRQEAPHPHCVIPMNNSTANDYFLTDLGADLVYMVRYNDSLMNASIVDYISLDPGSGPRHIIRHPTNNLIFVLNELNSSLLVFRQNSIYNYTQLQKYTTLTSLITPTCAADVDPSNTSNFFNAGHLAITKDGQFIVVSNRGRNNSIVVFNLDDPTSGALSVKSCAGSGGFHPRYFEIVGNVLVVGNQNSNTLVAFKFNNGTIGDKLDVMILERPMAIWTIAQFNTNVSLPTSAPSAGNCQKYNFVLLCMILLMIFYYH